jgi:IS30 family transposase
MGQTYNHLSLRERVEIELLRTAGHSLRWIGRRLGRPASTIGRELKRNAKPTKQWRGAYDGERAHTLARRRRRWDARFKLARQPDLRALVRESLAMGRSPEQIAGRLALEQGRTIISHESIYRFIYHRSGLKDHWHRLLPRAKSRRGRLRRGGASPLSSIPHRRSIRERPQEARDRRTPGHWETDTMLFARYGQSLLILHERCSRLILAAHPPDRKADGIARHLHALLEPVPPPLRRSLACDNGTEFARHDRLAQALGLSTFFCDPHSPWQKGGIENAIGRLRRRLPRRTDLSLLTPAALNASVQAYNHTPRKCLGWRTPAEVFAQYFSNVALQT